MNVNKIVVNEIPSEIEFSGAVLLSVNEVNTMLTVQERKYIIGWWLRSPGSSSYSACYVSDFGYVHGNGYVYNYDSFYNTHSGIRPALIISNLGGFKVGDILSIGEYYFKIISPKLAWLYRQDIGSDNFDTKTNEYNDSKIKQIVDSWYLNLIKEGKS